MIPDQNYDYYNITIDTIGQASKNTFSVYLTEPLKNVVQAKLLAAHIHTKNATQHCYISIDELNTNFSERATSDFNSQGEISVVRNSFASLISEDDTHGGVATDQLITFKNHYPIVHEYSTPIRRIDRLNVTLRNQSGQTIENANDTGNNFMIIQFTCQSPSMILP